MSKTSHNPFTQPMSEWVWNTRYRREASTSSATATREADLDQSWDRVARALASVERSHGEEWSRRYRQALADFHFLPGGRILANAGDGFGTTLFNCFVMGAIESGVNGMFESLRESMLTLNAGGGVGCDFSGVWPRAIKSWPRPHASGGVVAALRLWDEACAAVMDTDLRRGAMMATLRDDHPDLEAFIDAKRGAQGEVRGEIRGDLRGDVRGDVRGYLHGRPLRHFNLSVLVTDELMRAVERDATWPLVFPLQGRVLRKGGEICQRRWSGGHDAEDCEIVARVPARALWERIMRAAYDVGEPGVIFIDRVRRANNLAYCEQIEATNPCGEVPLPAYGACNLGSINLAKLVSDPFGSHAHFDLPAIAATTVMATRMLDGVYELSAFPLPLQAKVARRSRRIGIGVTGLADALVMLGLRYDSEAARSLAGQVMGLICHTAYRASTVLARERGSFPAFDDANYCRSRFVASLPGDIIESIHKHGIRNSHLVAIAPAGSISLFANNVSSGIEPIFAPVVRRRVAIDDGAVREWVVEDYAWALFRRLRGSDAKLPDAFITAHEVDPVAQLRMQASLQTHVDSAIAKTINVGADIGFDRFRTLYRQADEMGLKGCTIFRPNAATGVVLSVSSSVCGDHDSDCVASERATA